MQIKPPKLVFLSLLLGIANGTFFGKMVAWLTFFVPRWAPGGG
jgi:hypothetical protein